MIPRPFAAGMFILFGSNFPQLAPYEKDRICQVLLNDIEPRSVQVERHDIPSVCGGDVYSIIIFIILFSLSLIESSLSSEDRGNLLRDRSLYSPVSSVKEKQDFSFFSIKN